METHIQSIVNPCKDAVIMLANQGAARKAAEDVATPSDELETFLDQGAAVLPALSQQDLTASRSASPSWQP